MSENYIDSLNVRGTTFTLQDSGCRTSVTALGSYATATLAAHQAVLNALPETYAAISHSHAGTDVTITHGGSSMNANQAYAGLYASGTATASTLSAVSARAELANASASSLNAAMAALSNVYAPITHGHQATSIMFASGGSSVTVQSALEGRALSAHTHPSSDILHGTAGISIGAYIPSQPCGSSAGYQDLYFNRTGSWTSVTVTKGGVDSAIGATDAARSGLLYGVVSSGGSYCGGWVSAGAAGSVTRPAVLSALGATASLATRLLNDAGNWTSMAAVVTSQHVISALVSAAVPSSSLYLNQSGAWSLPQMTKAEIDEKLSAWNSGVVPVNYVYAMESSTVLGRGGVWKRPAEALGASPGGSAALYLNQLGSWTAPAGAVSKDTVDSAISAKLPANDGRIYTANPTSGGVWRPVSSAVTKPVVDLALGAFDATSGYVYAAQGSLQGGAWVQVTAPAANISYTHIALPSVDSVHGALDFLMTEVTAAAQIAENIINGDV